MEVGATTTCAFAPIRCLQSPARHESESAHAGGNHVLKQQPSYSSLRDYLRVIRQQWLVIVLVPLVFVGAALAISLRQEKRYRSETSLIFQDPSSDLDPIGAGLVARQTPDERAAVGAELVTRGDIARAVLKRVQSLAGVSVSARPEARTNFVVITVDAPSPQRAATVAAAFADETRRVLRTEFRRDLRRQIASTRPAAKRIRSLPDAQAQALQLQQDGRLRALEQLGEPAKIARPPTVSASAVSPKPVRNALLALIAGLTIGLIVAFTRAALDRRLRTSRDLASAVSLPLLARLRAESMGRFDVGKVGERHEPTTLGLESARILRTNLDFLDVDRKVSTVLVTSAVADEGKSTVAMALAVANALAGRRTLLVECDLRRPVLAGRLGLRAQPGLTDFVAGHAGSPDVLQDVELPRTSDNGAAPSDQGGSLTCITAGSSAPQPAELLASRSFADYLAVLARAYDVTILDSGPLLPVVDTLELVPFADRLVLCVRARRTRGDELRSASDAIERLPHPPTGLVVTDVGGGDELDLGYYSPYGTAQGEPATSPA